MWAQHQIKRSLDQPEAISRVQALLARHDVAHRTALADAVCADFGFRNARGELQRAGCLKALREFERAGRIVLPAPLTRGGTSTPRRRAAAVPLAQSVPDDVGALRDLTLVPVTSPAQRAIWNGLMAHEHPRGAGPLVGCQLRYLVGSAHGWLGAIGFGAAALKLRARDQWIGWDDAQRRRHLSRIVGLNRFLIRPTVHCHNLASHLLGRVLRRLGDDVEARFGYRPWLVETFVDRSAFSGVSLRAANWLYLGDSGGRGRQDHHHATDEPAKAIYIYPLQADWRARLGVGAAPPPASLSPGPLAAGAGLDASHWAEQEFGGAPLGDRRLSRRLVVSAQHQAENPLRAFTGVARDDRAAVKGYYRLIDQPESEDSAVTPQNMLAPHRAQTLRRMQAESTVLCVHDGTDLNFSGRPQTEGLGVIGSNQTGARSHGLHLHSTLAVSSNGLPLGVLRAQFEAPAPKTTPATGRGDAADRKSYRWIESLRDCADVAATLPQTRLISVMDREADFFSLFEEQRRRPQIDLLVRAKHNRRLPHDHDKALRARLFDTLRTAPIQGRMQLSVARQSVRLKRSKCPANPGRKARTATVALRYRQVTFESTLAEHAGSEPITLWVVHVREEAPPQGTAPLEWFLLTTVAVPSNEQAQQILDWYCLRWRIEDWHRVLKSGCKIEALAHHSAERLKRATAIRMVIAWRIMLMTLLGRETADELPADVLFSDIELKVLNAYATSRGRPAIATLVDAVRWVAILGGYQHRTRGPPPGHQLMWHGYVMMAGMCQGFLLYEAMHRASPG
jgi:hypothetical protein